MQLISSAFQHGSKIPQQYTCDGANNSPELSWRDAPDQTKSFALIMHDPDAPKAGGFTHWAVYNISANVAKIERNTPAQGRVAGVGIQGRNDSGRIGYTGPCPPSGRHRYFFRLYALNAEVDLPPGASNAQVQEAMRGHILEQSELMGTYARMSERAA